ncbi:MAG: heat-inducible transcription repressor HrcA [Armatimonadetes bacterium]|nr:heat-inducible transcription repressor HrcA [Armatimonadota bacterium]
MSLDERKQKILGAVVRDYVETVRPVGSEELAARHPWGVKSATIRNELADLAELGYLRQPHTSAGRIPSDRGYRFYVDHLMVARAVEGAPDCDARALDLEHLLRQTCALLTRMTSYTSVATPPRPADTRLSRVFVSPAGDGRLLVVGLFSTGQAENRLLGPPPDAPEATPAEIVALGNALDAALAGQTLDALAAPEATPPPPELQGAQRARFDALAEAVRQMARQAADEDQVYLEGTREILRQPEFRDVGKIESVLETLQRRTLLYQSLSHALWHSDVTVVIGAENPVQAMQECSVVTASYYVGARERGTIGVVGPTRMDYDRAVPAVSFFARSLSQTLTRLGGW